MHGGRGVNRGGREREGERDREGVNSGGEGKGGGEEASPEVIRIYPLHIAEIGFNEVMDEDIVGKPRLEIQ